MANLKIKKIYTCNNDKIDILLSNNNKISILKSYTNRLQKSSLKDFHRVRILPDKVWLHWDNIDEDITIDVLCN